jgi:hypothetical protein
MQAEAHTQVVPPASAASSEAAAGHKRKYSKTLEALQAADEPGAAWVGASLPCRAVPALLGCVRASGSSMGLHHSPHGGLRAPGGSYVLCTLHGTSHGYPCGLGVRV